MVQWCKRADSNWWEWKWDESSVSRLMVMTRAFIFSIFSSPLLGMGTGARGVEPCEDSAIKTGQDMMVSERDERVKIEDVMKTPSPGGMFSDSHWF